jgi:serine/threonine-protein kinase HipA
VPKFTKVKIWGQHVGVARREDDSGLVEFQYDPSFVASGLQLAPIKMPLADEPFAFPGRPDSGLHGLPGLLADSLPDRYGNALIDAWLATQGRSPDSFNVLERLCYIGSRGMGALEFQPVMGPQRNGRGDLDVAELAQLAEQILASRGSVTESFADRSKEAAMQTLLLVGTSAGGQRPKAVVAWNRKTNIVRSGQLKADPGFEYWILKFDGVDAAGLEFGTSKGYGAIEYAYSHMARAAGIEMTETHLLEEGGRRHFMTKRFDRGNDGSKVHMQSLSALQHFDFKLAGAYSYEQAFLTISELDLPMKAREQQFRRTTFNVIARNQDDHVKNIAFLMGPSGKWRLSPAYDVCYSFNPTGEWTATHQMSINGKRDNFVRDDLRRLGDVAGLRRGGADDLVDEVQAAVVRWPEFAANVDVPDETAAQIQKAHRSL